MEEYDIFLPEKKQILLYLSATRKKDIFFWFLTSFVFSSFSVVIEYMVSLYIPKKPFTFAVPAMEGKILLGAVLMGAASLIYYLEKKEKTNNLSDYSIEKEDLDKKKQLFNPEVLAAIQIVFLVLGCICVGLLTYTIRTQHSYDSSIFVNIVVSSYLFFVIIALVSLFFRFHFLWKESPFMDFREWDTKSGKYTKKKQKPFNNIKT